MAVGWLWRWARGGPEHAGVTISYQPVDEDRAERLAAARAEFDAEVTYLNTATLGTV
jgi:hypothetical protein